MHGLEPNVRVATAHTDKIARPLKGDSSDFGCILGDKPFNPKRPRLLLLIGTIYTFFYWSFTQGRPGSTELQLQLDFVSPILAYFPTNQSGFQHSVCGLSTKINHYWFTARLLLVKTCSRLLNQINLDNLQCQMKLRQNTHTHKTHPNTFSVLGHLQIILHGSDSFEFVYLRVRTP